MESREVISALFAAYRKSLSDTDYPGLVREVHEIPKGDLHRKCYEYAQEYASWKTSIDSLQNLVETMQKEGQTDEIFHKGWQSLAQAIVLFGMNPCLRLVYSIRRLGGETLERAFEFALRTRQEGIEKFKEQLKEVGIEDDSLWKRFVDIGWDRDKMVEAMDLLHRLIQERIDAVE